MIEFKTNSNKLVKPKDMVSGQTGIIRNYTGNYNNQPVILLSLNGGNRYLFLLTKNDYWDAIGINAVKFSVELVDFELTPKQV